MSRSLVLTLDDVAAELRISRRQVAREVASGRLKSVTYGRLRRVRLADLEAFVAQRDDSRRPIPIRRQQPRRVASATPGLRVPFPQYATEQAR